MDKSKIQSDTANKISRKSFQRLFNYCNHWDKACRHFSLAGLMLETFPCQLHGLNQHCEIIHNKAPGSEKICSYFSSLSRTLLEREAAILYYSYVLHTEDYLDSISKAAPVSRVLYLTSCPLSHCIAVPVRSHLLSDGIAVPVRSHILCVPVRSHLLSDGIAVPVRNHLLSDGIAVPVRNHLLSDGIDYDSLQITHNASPVTPINH